jgi:hypothetical protein
MATIALTTPYSLKNATFSVESDDYTAAISAVIFTPSTSTSTWRGIGGNVLKDQAIAEWTCQIDFAQDLAETGLLRYLLANEGASKAVTFVPVAEGPTVAATLVLTPGQIGGTADGNTATASVQLAVTGKPAFTDPS